MKSRRFAAAFIAVLPLLSACIESPEPGHPAPDTVLHDGKILTVDKDFSIVSEIGIKDGRIVGIGSLGSVLPLASLPQKRQA